MDRIKELLAEAKRLSETLQGCDWCCGGGDEAMDEIEAELKELGYSEGL